MMVTDSSRDDWERRTVRRDATRRTEALQRSDRVRSHTNGLHLLMLSHYQNGKLYFEKRSNQLHFYIFRRKRKWCLNMEKLAFVMWVVAGMLLGSVFVSSEVKWVQGCTIHQSKINIAIWLSVIAKLPRLRIWINKINILWRFANLRPEVTSLGVILDSDVSFNSHISKVTKSSFFHLRNS